MDSTLHLINRYSWTYDFNLPLSSAVQKSAMGLELLCITIFGIFYLCTLVVLYLTVSFVLFLDSWTLRTNGDVVKNNFCNIQDILPYFNRSETRLSHNYHMHWILTSFFSTYPSDRAVQRVKVVFFRAVSEIFEICSGQCHGGLYSKSDNI